MIAYYVCIVNYIKNFLRQIFDGVIQQVLYYVYMLRMFVARNTMYSSLSQRTISIMDYMTILHPG